MVFDVTRASTFDAVLKWKDDLDSKVRRLIEKHQLRPFFLSCHSVPLQAQVCVDSSNDQLYRSRGLIKKQSKVGPSQSFLEGIMLHSYMQK